MTKDEFFALKTAAWTVTTALCWLYAAAGHASTPRFDMWFWGIAFWVDVVFLGFSVTTLALHR